MKKSTYKKTVIFTMFSGVTLLTGCGLMPREQTISVATESNDGTQIEDMRCELKNKRGAWLVKTPAEVKVLRSRSKLNINCENNQWQTAKPLQVKSDSNYTTSAANGALRGLGVGILVGLPFSGLAPQAPIVLGGVFAIPGAGIRMALDGARGGAYEYPAKITAKVIPRSTLGEPVSLLENATTEAF